MRGSQQGEVSLLFSLISNIIILGCYYTDFRISILGHWSKIGPIPDLKRET